tara:strand:- start:43 stop:291 length:249 start_codon:yes stop_codon:yes gene_type:complete
MRNIAIATAVGLVILAGCSTFDQGIGGATGGIQDELTLQAQRQNMPDASDPLSTKIGYAVGGVAVVLAGLFLGNRRIAVNKK